MNDMMIKISAGLERAFATGGFHEPSVEDLRDAAGVSLRTLYKYVPSRDDMVHAALEYRNGRYLEHVFQDLPKAPEEALETILERVAKWMETEASHGCLFHEAVAASPKDVRLRELLMRHKSEFACKAAKAVGMRHAQLELMLILEGLMQNWPLFHEAALEASKRLGLALLRAD